MSKINYAFGIFQDGLNVKVAQLMEQDGEIKVQKLAQTKLTYPLYVKSDEGMIEMYQSQDEDTWDSSFEDVMDNISKIQEEEAATSKAELQNLLSAFPLEKGKISLNIDDEQITYYQFDGKVSAAKIYKTLKKDYIPEDELIAKDYQIGYFDKDEDSKMAIVQHGENYLLNAIKEIRKQMGKKKKFTFGHVNTNEVSLMNLLELNYDLQEDEFVLLLYVGLDYKVGIVMKGYHHFKSFPIIVNSSDPEEVRRAIYSKIMLQQDISNVPISQHIILAGEEIFVNKDTYEYFKENMHENDKLEFMELHNIGIDTNYAAELTNAEISRYAIPIALAWKTLIPQEKSFQNSNLLPTNILEAQKFHKITWHGYLALIAIFGFVLMATINHLELNQELKKVKQMQELSKSELTAIESQHQELLQQVQQLRKLHRGPTDFELSLQSIRKLQQDKKNWYFVLKKLEKMVAAYPITWITNLNTHEEGFAINAFTTKKRNIIHFANIFPDGFIQRINQTSVEGEKVWQFDVRYNFPEEKEVVAVQAEEPVLISQQDELYEIQVLASTDKQRVENLANKLTQADIPVKITKINNEKGLIYRLRLERSFKLAEAENRAKQLQKQFPQITDYWLAKKQQNFAESAVVEYNKAVDLYFQGNCKQALQEFKNFTAQYPHHYLANNARYLQGECYYKLGEIEPAKQVFLKSVENNTSKKPDALKLLGKIAMEQDKPEQAKYYWQQLIQTYPQHYLRDDVEKLMAELEQ
ncbi:MAG: hypothetical protein PWQ09_1484 [Candidatus Cloacimonadota bacterium]|jgi:TolA-binding protein|nr:hypothetical protein [Candidatus Cloacimonadota bacterium]